MQLKGKREPQTDCHFSMSSVFPNVLVKFHCYASALTFFMLFLSNSK